MEQGSWLNPKIFWQKYALALNEAGTQAGTRTAYRSSKAWTAHVMKISEKVWTDISYSNDSLKSLSKSQIEKSREYFRVDLIGYTTEWDKTKPDQQHEWDLRLAYEHENSDRWDDELCKLCHIVADLRVISSYYDFEKPEPIEEILQKRVDYLNREMNRINRVPGCQWLFIFGPRCKSWDRPFRAFTLEPDGSKNKVVEITGDYNVKPCEWME